MKKVRVTDLSGLALDWAVAKAEGDVKDWDEGADVMGLTLEQWHYKPSADWRQGGPIIERERIRVLPWDRPVGVRMHGEWYAGIYDSFRMNGPTPLVAAMRCYVASKLGNEVEIPEELCQ